MFTIVKREEMSGGNVILNEIDAPLIAKKAKPGQFVILKANENGERVPLTMAETDPERGTITVIYMVVGKSTALFRTLREGEGYEDVIGPLGKATHIEKVGNVVCVGGGTPDGIGRARRFRASASGDQERFRVRHGLRFVHRGGGFRGQSIADPGHAGHGTQPVGVHPRRSRNREDHQAGRLGRRRYRHRRGHGHPGHGHGSAGRRFHRRLSADGLVGRRRPISKSGNSAGRGKPRPAAFFGEFLGRFVVPVHEERGNGDSGFGKGGRGNHARFFPIARVCRIPSRPSMEMSSFSKGQ